MRTWNSRLLFAVTVVAVVLAAGSTVVLFVADDDSALDRVAAYSQILGLIFAALPLTLTALNQLAAARVARRVSDQELADVEQDLVAYVYSTESAQRAALLATDHGRTGTERINVSFRRVEGGAENLSGKSSGDLNSADEFFLALKPGRLVITGQGGSGKTLLALQLILQLIERRGQRAAARGDADLLVPVRFALVGYDARQPLSDWMIDEIADRFAIPLRLAQAVVERRRILPILDGLDEIVDDDRRGEATARFNDYISGTTRGALVLTCRQQALKSLNEPLRSATVVVVDDLSRSQIIGYLDGQHHDLAHPQLAALKMRLSPTARTVEVRALVACLSTPLRLTMAVSALRSSGLEVDRLAAAATRLHVTGNREPCDTAETAKLDREFLDLLFAGSVPGALHRLQDNTGLAPRRSVMHLRALAGLLAQQGRGAHGSGRLVPHELSVLVRDERPRMLHGALAVGSYFLILALILAAASSPARQWPRAQTYLALPENVSAVSVVAGVGALYLVVVVPVLVWRSAAAEYLVPSQLDVSGLRTIPGVWRFAQRARTGVIAGLVIGVAGLAAIGPETGLAAGASTALTAGIVMGLDRGDSRALRPADPLRSSTKAALIFAFTSSVVAGASAAALTDAQTTIAAIPIAAVAAGLATGRRFGGGGVAVRYWLTLAFVARRRQLPLRLLPFLEACYAQGLLRTAGIAYEFRHEELRAWLTRTSSSFDDDNRRRVPEGEQEH